MHRIWQLNKYINLYSSQHCLRTLSWAQFLLVPRGIWSSRCNTRTQWAQRLNWMSSRVQAAIARRTLSWQATESYEGKWLSSLDWYLPSWCGACITVLCVYVHLPELPKIKSHLLYVDTDLARSDIIYCKQETAWSNEIVCPHACMHDAI